MKKRFVELSYADFAITALIFEGAFAESLHRKDNLEEETRRLVERLTKRRSKGVRAKDVAHELGISIHRAYARLRKAEKAGVIERSNKPEKRNAKRFVPTPRPSFVPDPEELYHKLNLKRTVKFVHPITGRRIVYRHHHR